MRSFEFARRIIDNGVVTDIDGSEVKAFPSARLPEYATKCSAGADFFSAETVTIPSIWKNLVSRLRHTKNEVGDIYLNENGNRNFLLKLFQPTLVHTGIKANMEDDEVLELYNRSSNPKKLGLVLANGVGVIDADYYNNEDNDGEIMFSFYNFLPFDIVINTGDKIGQGVFKKFLRPEKGLVVNDKTRTGGFGSTGK